MTTDPQDAETGWYSMTWIAMEVYPDDLHVLIRRLRTLSVTGCNSLGLSAGDNAIK